MTICSQAPVLGWLKELCGHWNCLPSDEVLDSSWPFSHLFCRIYMDLISLKVELQPLCLSTVWSKLSLYSHWPLTPPSETSLPLHAIVSVWPPHLSQCGCFSTPLPAPNRELTLYHTYHPVTLCFKYPPGSHFFATIGIIYHFIANSLQFTKVVERCINKGITLNVSTVFFPKNWNLKCY